MTILFHSRTEKKKHMKKSDFTETFQLLITLAVSTCFLILTLTSCSVPESVVVISDYPPEHPLVSSLLSELPFPAMSEAEYLENKEDFLALSKLSIEEFLPFSEYPEEGITLHREQLAPVCDLLSPLRSVSSQSLLSYFSGNGSLPEDIRILPLEQVRLPQRALAVDDMYLNDPHYPLFKRIGLFVEKMEEPEPTGLFDNIHYRFTERRRSQQIKILREAEESWLEKLRQESDLIESRIPELFWISSVGDMMLGRGVSTALRQPGGVQRVFGDTLQYLSGSDISAGNLEGTLSRGKGAVPKSFNFAFPSWVLQYLEEAGFHYLTLTNNHIWDYGLEGFLDTLKLMERSPIASSGAGRDLSEASEPWLKELGNTTFAILSIGAFPRERNGFDGKATASAGDEKPGILFIDRGAREAMKNHFSGDSFNILYVHGGHEWWNSPGDEYEKLYRSFVDLGADLIIGSHPHVLQRMEAYKGSLIAYSLGNFIFPGMYVMDWAEDSIILRTGVSEGRLLYVEPIPAKLSGVTVDLDKNSASLTRFLNLQ
jgi:poly-gamma-glutamate capsule biosynthesis protein CapA/YwtB (metallophosphatase superfamily)